MKYGLKLYSIEIQSFGVPHPSLQISYHPFWCWLPEVEHWQFVPGLACGTAQAVHAQSLLCPMGVHAAGKGDGWKNSLSQGSVTLINLQLLSVGRGELCYVGKSFILMLFLL